jgi:putative transcriptional regulator
MPENIQNRIKEIRKELKLTQEELGLKLSVSRQTIISIERGKYIPSLPLALKIGKFFKISVEEIFSLDDQ